MISNGQKPGARYKKLVELGESANDCWNWIGCKNEVTGYGKKQWHGEPVLAHRWVWMMLFGKIPDGMVINHICSNRACVNPRHLEITDQAGNCRHGVGAKLNESAVKEIRKGFANRKRGETRRVLSQRFGVTPMTISDIWHGKSWKDIQP